MDNSFIVPVTDEERFLVMQSLKELNEMEHVRFMSLDTIATSSLLKKSKVRHVLDDLLKKQFITRYIASENPKLPRYYYKVEASGEAFICDYLQKLDEDAARSTV